LIEFVDDGVTGTSRDRNEFNRMITAVESGFAPFTAVIVKDLSRFARDHIRADMLIEETFPTHDIRLISVSEGLTLQMARTSSRRFAT
jgi:DNA invertase Pin-like site-specific DNA recombinase